MVKDDCIFCKLANGVFQTNVLYEDDDFTVFMDASPATKGHCLIVPKQHFKDISEMDDELLQKVMPLAKKMYATLKDKLHCEGFNVVQNNEVVAGQTVFHFHVHLIPRYSDDNQNINWKPGEPKDGELEAIKAQILA